jgi:hypothetical protein
MANELFRAYINFKIIFATIRLIYNKETQR